MSDVEERVFQVFRLLRMTWLQVGAVDEWEVVVSWGVVVVVLVVEEGW